MNKKKKSDFLLMLPEVVCLLERAELLNNCSDMEQIRPYIGFYKPHDVVKCELYGDMSRSTFYRTLKVLTDEGEEIRKRLIDLCM